MRIQAIHKILGYQDFIINKDGEIIVNGVVFEISETKIKKVIKELEAQTVAEAKVKAIETHIYSNYPLEKQTQDDKWEANFSTKLKATGVKDLEEQIVKMVISFLSGKSFVEIFSPLSEEAKPLYEKLVKIGLRNEWCYLCIQEGKKAIAENRNAVYPEFPKFD